MRKHVVLSFLIILGSESFSNAQTVEWSYTYGGSGRDVAYVVREVSNGGFVIVGETYSFGAGSADVWLIRIDEKGDTLWTRTYGGSDENIGYSVWETVDDCRPLFSVSGKMLRIK